MASPTDVIEFVPFHRPTLLDGEYTLTVQQQVKIDEDYKWGKDQWSTAPSTQLQFSVAGPRFRIDPGLIQSQFPPPKSIGEYYNVLPHIIFNRTTLPWERTIDNSSPSKTAQPISWMALLLFDNVRDANAFTVKELTVQDLLTPPAGAPEFVKVLPREPKGQTQPGELRLEVGQHPNDPVTVIDVSKQLLWQLLPGVNEIAFLSHVRKGQDAADPTITTEYPVILCNRLPAPGTSDASPVGSQSTVHLVSLEARKQLLDELNTKTKPPDTLVRLVSLASWSFSTLQRNKTFSGWLQGAWSPDTNQSKHTLRMPASENVDAESFLAQGYAPIKHQTRQGNHLVSWYRSPLVPGQSPAVSVTLPVRTSDELVRYFSDVSMFDTSYAAAWELGRMLTLRSKKVSVSLFNWKRAHAQQLRQAESAVSHLPFAPDYSIAPDFPEQASHWFKELLCLKHVPFHYLVPREEMLPVNSLRFFQVDINWLECLLDGAFSVGRVTSADVSQDSKSRNDGRVPNAATYSGFLLRSPVVTGWPNLGVEAYTEAPPGDSPTERLRFDRLGEDVLLCLFKGEIKTIDIHEHRETIHFGVDSGKNPADLEGYSKKLRDQSVVQLDWKSDEKRTLNIAALATRIHATDSAKFGVTMIEGVEKVRFIKA